MKYSATFGSFIRGGDYPLEADYIFNSVEELLQWCAENQGILHDGLLKIVKEEDSQTLYWCYNKEFYPLCDLDTFENLEFLKDFVGLVKDIDSLSENLKNLNNIQQELDLTQLSVGLNASGAFSTIAMQDTKYMSGARSIIDCLVALDKAISAKLVGEGGEIVDLEGYATEEWVEEQIESKSFFKSGTADKSIVQKSESNNATGTGSFVIGQSTNAYGSYAVAEGRETLARGNYSHAEGLNTEAVKACAHAEGYHTKAGGNHSHAEGYYTLTTLDYEHAQGLYNISNDDTLSSIGNGSTDSQRHNAFEVKKDGTILITDISSEEEIHNKPMINLQNILMNLNKWYEAD